MNKLQKTINPWDFEGHVAVTSKEAEGLVNYRDHTHPEAVEPRRQEYEKEVLFYPRMVAADHRNMYNGVAAKVVYQVPSGNYYIVKPYYEKVHTNYQHYPLGGWAEMTNQALYHAGDIGHMHQSVHIAEHQLDRIRPMVVIGVDKDARYLDFLSPPYHPNVHHDLAKIGFMDFLSNNNDRHLANLLWRPNPANNNFASLLAIDHERSFQYKQPNRWLRSEWEPRDHLFDYLEGSHAMRYLGGASDDAYLDTATDWWRGHSRAIRQAFSDHVNLIADPEVHDWINKNFQARANVLDRFAELWKEKNKSRYYRPTKIIHLGQFHVDWEGVLHNHLYAPMWQHSPKVPYNIPAPVIPDEPQRVHPPTEVSGARSTV